MQIIIENCSSPGAHFSDHTNSVLIKIYSWIKENRYPKLSFIEFRKRLKSELKINDNNARNIYPLLKNSLLIEYHSREELETKSFFTKRGLAYLKALETREQIKNSAFSKEEKERALSHVKNIESSIIYDSLENLLRNKELNYSEGLRWYLLFLREYKKISKKEFALMIYFIKQDKRDWKNIIESPLSQYRNGDIALEVKVKVRNDNEVKKSTGKDTRVENISYFTAYSYFTGLINQAGLTKIEKDYAYVIEEKKEKIDYLLGV